MSEGVVKVQVKRQGHAVYWLSKPTQRGWKCGYCLRGNLGLDPREGQSCVVCGAVVNDVIYWVRE